MTTASRPTTPTAPTLDLLTIMAIGIVSFIVKNVLHEALGHGGACLLVGGTPLYLSTAHFECDYAHVSDFGVRFVAAAGTLVNLVAAVVFWLILRSGTLKAPSLKYFCWFAMCGNYFVGAGYPLFSGVLGVGDWVAVVDGYEPAGLWRAVLAVTGLALYVLGIWLCLRAMPPLIGSHPTERLVRASKLTVYPYLAGAFAASIGALFNPIGSFVIFTSASASFGGASAFAWMTQMLKGNRFPERSESYVDIERNWGWIGLAIVLMLIHILILGPSIRFK